MKTWIIAVAVVLVGAGPVNRDAQLWVAQVTADFRAKYDQAPNDMAKGLVRHQRAAALCDPKGLISPGRGQVKDWTGLVSELDAVSDGRGILAVQISPMVTLHTENNALAEKLGEPTTLIPIDSPLYATVVKLAVKQHVRFSGTFFPSPDDCMKETSLTPEGGMEEPEFLFRFTDVQPIE